MSIERELLKRVISGDDDGDFFINHRLYKDIETFLDQPEQPEQEPDSYTTGVAAKKLFRVLGWTNKGEEK